MTKAAEKKEEVLKDSSTEVQDDTKVSEKDKKESNDKKKIVIKETEEDIILGTGFTGDPEDFKEEIRREAEKGGVFAKYVMPLFFVVLVGAGSAFATWYYSKPERSIEAEVRVEDKIETPPMVEEQQNVNPETPAETLTPPATEKKEITYTVQEGDTMSGIANKYDMTSTELATFNGLTDANTLRIGQVLKIPVK